MKYRDPLPIDCPNCGATHAYPVEDLLNSRAACLMCNYRFDSIGKEMRNHLAHWSHFFNLVVFLIDLEDELGIQIKDREVENLKTLDDLFGLTLTKLPLDCNREDLKRIIIEAVAKASDYPVTQIALEMDLKAVLKDTDPFP